MKSPFPPPAITPDGIGQLLRMLPQDLGEIEAVLRELENVFPFFDFGMTQCQTAVFVVYLMRELHASRAAVSDLQHRVAELESLHGKLGP